MPKYQGIVLLQREPNKTRLYLSDNPVMDFMVLFVDLIAIFTAQAIYHRFPVVERLCHFPLRFCPSAPFRCRLCALRDTFSWKSHQRLARPGNEVKFKRNLFDARPLFRLIFTSFPGEGTDRIRREPNPFLQNGSACYDMRIDPASNLCIDRAAAFRPLESRRVELLFSFL